MFVRETKQKRDRGGERQTEGGHTKVYTFKFSLFYRVALYGTLYTTRGGHPVSTIGCGLMPCAGCCDWYHRK